MPIAPSAQMILLEDKTTNGIPIPHNDLFELHALFSKSLAWMEARRHMIHQLDRPSRSNPPFSFEWFLIDLRPTKVSISIVAQTLVLHLQTNLDHSAMFYSSRSLWKAPFDWFLSLWTIPFADSSTIALACRVSEWDIGKPFSYQSSDT